MGRWILTDTLGCGFKVTPRRLAWREALPHVACELGDLAVVKAVPEGRHEAELRRRRFANAFEDDTQQVVRMFAVQIAIER